MTFEDAIAAYRSWDPAGWVRLYEIIPTWAGIVAAALGLALLLVGGGKFFRLIAGPMGALVGAVWVPAVVRGFGVMGKDAAAAMLGAAALAIAGFAFPPAVVLFAVGLPAGLVAGQLVGGGEWVLGFVPAFLLVGAAGAAFSRHIGSVVASVVGAWALALGLLAALHQTGEVVRELAQRPWLIIGGAAVFALAGSAFQLTRPNPERAAEHRLEKSRQKQARKEKEELERKWGKFEQ